MTELQKYVIDLIQKEHKLVYHVGVDGEYVIIKRMRLKSEDRHDAPEYVSTSLVEVEVETDLDS